MATDSVFNRTLKTGENAYHARHMISLGRDYMEMLTKGTNLSKR